MSDPDTQDLIHRIANKMETAADKFSKAKDRALESNSNKELHTHGRIFPFLPNRTKKGKYQVLRDLGAGSFAMVHEVQEVDTGKHYVRKRLHRSIRMTPGIVKLEAPRAGRRYVERG